jgi:hypothetical protein
MNHSPTHRIEAPIQLDTITPTRKIKTMDVKKPNPAGQCGQSSSQMSAHRLREVSHGADPSSASNP